MYCNLLLMSCKHYNHVLCAWHLIHYMKAQGALICIKCTIVNYSNQIYDVICLLYSITLYQNPTLSYVMELVNNASFHCFFSISILRNLLETQTSNFWKILVRWRRYSTMLSKKYNPV